MSDLVYVPEVIEQPSPNHSPRKAGVRVDTVLIHHTGNVNGRWSDKSALSTLCNPAEGVSAHYLVDTKGKVFRLVAEGRKAWHAGLGHLPWEKGPWRTKGQRLTNAGYDFNHRSIGIEVVNPGDGKTPFTEKQYRALEWLVPDILGRIKPDRVRVPPGLSDFIPMAAGGKPFTAAYVLGHRDVAPGRKTDPADNFDWGRIRAALQGGST